MHKPTFIHLSIQPIPMSFLEIDCDVNAERLQVFDRKTGDILSHKRVINGYFKCILNVSYSLENNLICLMLDDSQKYNAAVVDNVKAMTIDLASFDPSNPIPYELL